MSEVTKRIDQILNESRIVLFMKGTAQEPLCGFSARAIAILNECKCQYQTVNVLEDQDIREGIKAYGNWPTIPQLYINKTLVGGSDIMMEMFENGELQDQIKQ